MKKVININFQGRVIPIEEGAYDILKVYVESLRTFFADEEGRDEIINDIEGRIAELFGETLKKGTTCITDDDVTRIIDSMGRPQDFEDDETKVKSQLGSGAKEQESSSQSSSQQSYTNTQTGNRRLYRDENHKFLGGVCSGIANYFGTDPVIVRILFVIFCGPLFIPYLILWVAVPSTATKVIGSQRKRLFRDPDDKIISGVCSGLSQYFGVNVWIPRLLFLIPFFSFAFRFGHWAVWDFPHFLSVSFSPGVTFVYIILWIVLPEARSSADKLEMKGEKVDLHNIKSTIQNDMEGFKDRAQQFGNDVKEKAQQFGKEFGETVGEKGKQFGNEAASVARRTSRGFGDVIIMFVRIFSYFVIGCVLFSVVCGLFALGVVFTGMLPLKEFVINSGWQNIFAWGTLMLFIWVPVIGIVTFIIRRIARAKANSRIIRSTFLALWLLGLVCFIGLISSLRNDFRYSNHPQEKMIPINNAKLNKLEVTIPPYNKYYGSRWFDFQPFASLDDDTAFVQNIAVHVVKSTNDSFQVTMISFANGSTKAEADEIVSKIRYNVIQKDSSLILDKGIPLTVNEKFRNQHIEFYIAVPVGKRIKIDNSVGWNRHVRLLNWDNEWEWRDQMDRGEESWAPGIEYIQTADNKLQRADKKKGEVENNDDENGDNSSIENFNRSKDEMIKERDRKLKEAQDINKALQTADSTRYHYKPDTLPKVQPKKSKPSAKAATGDMPPNFLMMKFSI